MDLTNPLIESSFKAAIIVFIGFNHFPVGGTKMFTYGGGFEVGKLKWFGFDLKVSKKTSWQPSPATTNVTVL